MIYHKCANPTPTPSIFNQLSLLLIYFPAHGYKQFLNKLSLSKKFPITMILFSLQSPTLLLFALNI